MAVPSIDKLMQKVIMGAKEILEAEPDDTELILNDLDEMRSHIAEAKGIQEKIG